MNVFKVLLFISLVVHSNSQESTLELIHVLFRHGARTPELKDVYPTDPYKEEDFVPMGWGQLTNSGKQMAFKLGEILRKRYNKFLGEIYTPDLVYAQSTDFDRTKMTALLVLAGLFPPSKSQVWNEDIPWLPIPLSYEKEENDFFLTRPDKYCPLYSKELNNILQSEEILAELASKQDTLDYLSNHTGKEISSYANVFSLYQTLTAQTFLNYSLPEWAQSVYPGTITEMATRQCELEIFTPNLKKLFGGKILRRIIQNMIAKSTKCLEPLDRKIFLYSGHEHTVFSTLAALGLFDHNFPNYASATIYELHNLGDKYAVKILYQKDLDKDPEVQQIRNCDILCPLDKFIELSEPVVPKNYTEECQSEILINLN